MGSEVFAITREVTEGTNPATGAVEFPHQSFDQGRRPQTATGGENRPGLTPDNSELVADEQGGGITFRTRLPSLLTLLPGAILDDFSTPVDETGALTLSALGVLEQTGSDFSGIVAGQAVHISGLTAVAGNPDTLTLYAASDGVSDTVQLAYAGTARAAGVGGRVRASMARRSASTDPTRISYTTEKQFKAGSLSGSTTRFALAVRQFIQQLDMSARTGDLGGGSVQFIGQPEVQSASSAIGTVAAAAASRLISPVRSIPRIGIADTLANLGAMANARPRASEVSMSLSNNHTADRDLSDAGLGTSGGISDVTLGVPVLTVSASLNHRWAGFPTLLAADAAGTRQIVSWTQLDGLGNAFTVTLPQAFITQAPLAVANPSGTRFSQVQLSAETCDGTVLADWEGVGFQFDFFAA